MSKSMWNEIFDTDVYMYGKEPNDFLKSDFTKIPKGKVLLLADGEGRNSVFLAKHGYEVTAVDISDIGLKKAEQLAVEAGVNITTVCEDLATFDLGEDNWDGIVSIYCHLPAKLRQDLYQRVETGLKKGGVFFLEGYTPEQLKYNTGGPPVAEMMISKQTLTTELPNLTLSYLAELEREVHEGVNHNGLAAVIQAIGVK